MSSPRNQNEVKGYQRLAHELAYSLSALEGVTLLEPSGEPDPGLAYEEFAIRWHMPCLVLSQGDNTVDDRSLPWSSDVTRPPAGALRGVNPLDGVARDISQTMYQKLTQLGFQARQTIAWQGDTEGCELIAYALGGYTFTACVGPGPREDLAEITIRIMVKQNEFESNVNPRNPVQGSLI